MGYRKHQIVTNSFHHVFSRSIAKYTIFNNDEEYQRMIELIQYYQYQNQKISFSRYNKQSNNIHCNSTAPCKLVNIISYCLMPTHFHLALEQLVDKGITIFLGKVLNSYTKFFNIKHKRRGPLWDATFKNVPIETNEQLKHLTRYIHLNPVSANLIDEPNKWKYSSYSEYINENYQNRICTYDQYLDINPTNYKEFTEDRIDYQKELQRLKSHLF